MVKRQITSDKQTYSPAITNLFGTITAAMQSYKNDSKRASNSLELGVLINAEIKKSKNNSSTTKLDSSAKTEKTLTEKISETNIKETSEKDELTTLPGKWSNNNSFGYNHLPELEKQVDYNKFFSYKPEQKKQMYEEEQKKEEITKEIKTVEPEVIIKMTKNTVAEKAPEYAFLREYVPPKDKEKYALHKILNQAATYNMELSMLHRGIILN